MNSFVDIRHPERIYATEPLPAAESGDEPTAPLPVVPNAWAAPRRPGGGRP